MSDSLLVLAIILAAAAYLSARVFRTLKAARDAREGECGGGCGCSAPARKSSFWRRRAA